jgi:hypothetical protein
LYLLQISWINLGSVPISINYLFTVLILFPTFSNREFLPFTIVLFGVTNEFYINDTFFIINVSTFYGIVIVIWDLISKKNIISNINSYFLTFLFLMYCLMLEISMGNSLTIAEMPLYVRSFIWFYIFVFLINSKKSLELVFIGFIVSTVALLTVHLFLNEALTASKLTTDELNNLDFVSTRDRNYLSFNFSMTYPILLGIYLGFIDLKSVKINKYLLIGIIGFTILGIIALSSRTVIIVLILVTLASIFVGLKKSSKSKNVQMFKKTISLIIIIIGVIFLAANQGYLNLLIYRIFEEGSLEDGSGRTDIVSVFWRNFNNLEFYKQFLGQGYGTQYKLTGGQDTHNDYLAILASYGYLGIILWFIILFRLIEFKNISFPTIALIAYLIGSLGVSPMMVFSTPLFLAAAISYKSFFSNSDYTNEDYSYNK